jgi:formylglycine-generating enzyme required for sulfatase activity
VVKVSWIIAQKYCGWTGSRLPSEAEWEKAARGGLEGKKYPWGDESPVCTSGAENGAKYDNDSNCDDTGTEKVGNFSSNGYGLFDMSGNVWEWVNDWYDTDYYANSPGSNPSGPSSGSVTSGDKRVLRGGSWSRHDFYLRSANRSRYNPTDADIVIGFRCSRSQ